MLIVLMAPGEGGSPAMALIVQLALIFLIFYWLLIRPQRKERERHEALVTGLKKGDRVATAGGIIGTIVHVAQDRVTLKTAENTRLEVERGKITQALTDDAEG